MSTTPFPPAILEMTTSPARWARVPTDLRQRVRHEACAAVYRSSTPGVLESRTPPVSWLCEALLTRQPGPMAMAGITADDLMLIGNPVQFVDFAYQRILGRPLDASGGDRFVTMAAAGHRLFVLNAILMSAEARSKGAALPGLGLAGPMRLVWLQMRMLPWSWPSRALSRFYHSWRLFRLAFRGRDPHDPRGTRDYR